MKKIFYLAVAAFFSVGFVSCGDDEKVQITDEGYYVKSVTFDGGGASGSPLAGGLETTINGSGFSSATQLYIRPASPATRTDAATLTDDAVRLTVKSATESSVTFATPFLYGTYELLQKEGTLIYTLGNMYFKAAKQIKKINAYFGAELSAYEEFTYDGNGRITIIKTYRHLLDPETYLPGPIGLAKIVELTYSSNNLTRVKTTNEEYGNVTIQDFAYNGNTITETQDGVEDRVYTLTDGVLTEKYYEQIQSMSEVVLDEDGNPVMEIGDPIIGYWDEVKEEWINEPKLDADGNQEYYTWEKMEEVERLCKYVTTYSYNTSGNLIKATESQYKDGVIDPGYQVTYLEATFGTYKSFLAPGSLPAWYYGSTQELLARTGLVNELILTPGMGWGPMPGEDNIYVGDFDDDLYPKNQYLLKDGEREELGAYYTFEYAE